MSEKPLVSVVVPVYNTEKYLKQCLNSIVNQSYRDIEIICVDDGSTDGSLGILEDFEEKDGRFLIIKQKNLGAGAARNNGFSYVRGKYTIFLDSDDFFDLKMIEKLVCAAEENRADLVVCSACRVGEDDNILENNTDNWPINVKIAPIKKVFSWQDYPKDIFSLFGVIPWNKLFLTALIKENNLKFQEIPSSNDVYFGTVSRFVAKKIFIIDEKLVFYRDMREGNISCSRANNAINSIHAAIEVKNYLVENGLFENLRKAYFKVFHNHVYYNATLCDYKQLDCFLNEAKSLLLPKEYDELFSFLLRKDFSIENFYSASKNQKVFLWGASIFLASLLKREKVKNENILGIIDKNRKLTGKILGNYKIYSPEILNTVKNVKVLMTVYSNNEIVYETIKNELAQNYPHIEILPNVFVEGG